MEIPRHVILFGRAPRLGQVKQRLSKDIGQPAAWAFYRRNFRNIARRLAYDQRWKLWLAITPDNFKYKEPFFPNNIPILCQGQGELGIRMYRCLSKFCPHPTLLVGTDIPSIKPEIVWQAFKYLNGNDAVFGPAFDGGYWLVGLRPRLLMSNPFNEITWSRSDTLEKTISSLPLNTRIKVVKRLHDVDDGKSYYNFYHHQH